MGMRGSDIERVREFLTNLRPWFNDDWANQDGIWKLDEKGMLTNGDHVFDIGYVVEDAAGGGDPDEKRISDRLKEVFPDGDGRNFWPMVGLIKTLWWEHIFEGMKIPQPRDKAWHDRWRDEGNANFVDCPKCPAAQYQRCISATGKRTATHAARIKAGREEEKNPTSSHEEVSCTTEGCANSVEVGRTSKRNLATIICKECADRETEAFMEEYNRRMDR